MSGYLSTGDSRKKQIWKYVITIAIVLMIAAGKLLLGGETGQGTGRLIHSPEGFHLTGCDGKLDYRQLPGVSYSLYSDYYWYEIGDMICIGDTKLLYYCFPLDGSDVAAKTRLAAEELYRMSRKRPGKDAAGVRSPK